MIDLSCFTSCIEGLRYFGANDYLITDAGKYYAVHVAFMDDAQENVTREESYAASSLSTAIATIEALERGEEV